jgi:hypothetical protein
MMDHKGSMGKTAKEYTLTVDEVVATISRMSIGWVLIILCGGVEVTYSQLAARGRPWLTAKSDEVELRCVASTSYGFSNRFAIIHHSIVACIIQFGVSSNRLCICLMQKQRLNKIRDSLEVAINEMSRTRELLKKIADILVMMKCFSLHEIPSSLE